MINKEDKADVKRVMGSKVASKVAKATDDSKSKALKKAKGLSKYKEKLFLSSDPYHNAKFYNHKLSRKEFNERSEAQHRLVKTAKAYD